MQISHHSIPEQPHRAGLPFPPAATDPAPRLPALDPLEQLAVTVTLRKDAEIYGQGDDARYCYRILSGCIRSVKLMEDGRRQVNEFLLPGDWFGFEALAEHAFAAEAVSEVVLRRYPRRAIDALAEQDPRIARWLFDLAAGQLRAARERMVTLGRKTAAERIAGFLLEMGRRMPQDDHTGAVRMPMSRTDVADHLGLTIETVCRCLAQFRREGSIRLARSSFAVQSRAALHAHASASASATVH